MLIDEELCNQKFAQTFIYHDYKHLKHDTNQHWYECDCGEIQNKEHHFDADLNEKCDICGQRLPNYFVVKTGIKD